MDMTCISFGTWLPYALGAVLLAGMAIGFSLRLGLDYAELATYRRIARREADTVVTRRLGDRLGPG